MINDINADTEFNDALRAHGIIPPRPPTPPSPSTFLPTESELLNHLLDSSTPAQLSLLEEDANSDDERLFQSYRLKKLAEMKEVSKLEQAARAFGAGGDGVGIRSISRDEFVLEVSEGSKKNVEGEDEEEEDVWDDLGVRDESKIKPKTGGGMGVVCFLYKDSIPLSQHLNTLLLPLSLHHPLSKFVKIPASQCIENYPDKNVPTLLCYRNGDVVGQLMPASVGGVLRMGMGVQDLERLLLHHQVLLSPSSSLATHLRETAAAARDRDGYGPGGAQDSSDEDDEDEESGTFRRGKKGTGRGLRTGGKGFGVGAGKGRGEDEGSDYDM